MEQFAPGMYMEWLYEGQVFAAKLESMSRESIGAYVDKNLEVIRKWPEDKLYLTLQDGSHPVMGLSPYLQKRGQEIYDLLQERGLEGRIATIVPRTIAGRIITRTFNLISRVLKKKVEQRIFTEREAALEWLKELLPARNPSHK